MSNVLVAVDAENISYRLLNGIDGLANRLGTVVGKKVFGDFEMPRMKPWTDVSKNLGYEKIESPHIRSKNIADMTMIIDIMEDVFEMSPDIVVIGTGDGDFVPLVNKLKSKGIVVVGAGTLESSNHFKQACNFFRVPDEITISSETKALLPKSMSKVLSRISAKILKDYRRQEWVPISILGDEISNQRLSFDYRKLGFANLTDALLVHPGFEVKKINNISSFRKRPLNLERVKNCR